VTELSLNPSAGYPWDMMASRKLEARLAAIIAERGIQPATDEQMEAKEREIRQEQADRKAEILLGRLDARYRDAMPRTRESAEWLLRYVAAKTPQDRGRGLILLGASRAGKTWEAAAIARRLLVKHRIPVQFVEAPEMMAALRPNAEGASDIGQFMAAPVLVIDDLGAERTSEWTAEQMFRLAHYRDVHCLPTIITSNLEGPQLRERYGDRVINRLAEGATLIRLVSPERPFRETPL
jgi:DNA replication protein DnaC